MSSPTDSPHDPPPRGLSFRAKLVLLLVAGLNALIFHKTVFRGVAAWDKDSPTPWRAKLAGGCSLAVWIGVVAMGRALAYA